MTGYVVFGSNGESVYLDQEEKLALVETVSENLPHDKVLIAGSTGHLLAALALGASIGILTFANVAPDECCKIFDDFRSGRYADAR